MPQDLAEFIKRLAKYRRSRRKIHPKSHSLLTTLSKWRISSLALRVAKELRTESVVESALYSSHKRKYLPVNKVYNVLLGHIGQFFEFLGEGAWHWPW